MTCRHRPRIIAAAATALLLVAPATPAAASEALPRPAVCATGAISAYASGFDDSNQPLITISGWMRQCEPLTSLGRFGFVHYYTGGVLFPFFTDTIGIPPRDYAPAGAPTEFTASTRTNTGGTVDARHGPLVALCLVRDRDSRIACLEVSQPDPLSAPVVTPLRVDDERLRMPPPPEPGSPPTVEINPHCGNCI